MRFSIRVLMLVMAPVLVSAHETGQSAIHCSVNSQTAVSREKKEEIREVQRSVEAGPFYRELVSEIGRPEGCNMKVDGDDVRLSYVFHGKERLQVTWDPTIEYSIERVRLPSVTARRALDLLKAAEKHSHGPDGCGIKWTEPSREKGKAPGSSEVVYWGDACNCSARYVYTGDGITELSLSSAC